MKEEIKHFKSLLRQGSLRHMNILLDDKFQKELQTIIEDYEKLQQENKQLKDNWNKLKEFIVKAYYIYLPLEASAKSITILIDKMQELERGVSDVEN